MDKFPSIKYTASSGRVYDFRAKGSTKIKAAGFHSYEWDPDTDDLVQGVKVNAFKRKSAKYEMELLLIGARADNRSLRDAMHDDFERDVETMHPGKLTWGDYNLDCYVIESETEPDDVPGRVLNKIKFYAPYPYWYSEQTYSYAPYEQVTDGKTYDYTYEYTYGRKNTTDIIVGHYKPVNYKAVVYGPAGSVHIAVGDKVIAVNAAIDDGGYMVIDSRPGANPDRRCYTVSASGVITNVFDMRDPAYELFSQIQPGHHTLNITGSYAVDLTIFKERSEPTWTI